MFSECIYFKKGLEIVTCSTEPMGGRKFKLVHVSKNEEIKRQKAKHNPPGRPRKQTSILSQ